MSKPKKYDFSGWATRFGIRCSDGRTITNGAFDDCDGVTVPIVYSHNHDDIQKVLGHALLEKRDEGIYAYGSFNNTENGKTAKELVNHGDISSLSIYANNLKQDSARNVLHGKIRELSLVLAGANPGAKIDFGFAHSDDMENDILAAAIFNPDQELELFHEESIETPEITEETKEKEEPVVTDESVISHAEEPKAAEEGGKTMQEVYESMTQEQKDCCAALVGLAVEEAEANKSEGEDNMKHSAFENETNTELTLTHDEEMAIFKAGRKLGTLNEAVDSFLADETLAHSGITNIDYFFPESKFVGKVPEVITDDEEWVSIFMNGTKKSPFARVKTIYMDVRDQRAHGYVKGSQKNDDTLAALKRSTNPTTVYKLMKFDRDDIVDLEEGGFEAVSFVKQDMQRALRLEVAIAAMFGDGRQSSADDKIDPLAIRPIYGDNAVYAVPVGIEFADGLTLGAKAKQLISDAVRARKQYKGTGKPIFFTTEDWLTEMLLIEDTNGHRIYKNKDEIATALRCSDIVSVPAMDNKTSTHEDGYIYELAAIIVNPVDYNFGACKKGEVKLFEDFILDYNKQEYLIETRKSGALVRPYSALVLEIKGEQAGE